MDRYTIAIFGGLLFIAGFSLHAIFEDLWWHQNTNAALAGLMLVITFVFACSVYVDKSEDK